MPADSATAYVRNGIAWGDMLETGEPKAAGGITAGSSCGEAGSPGILEAHSPPLKDLRDLRGSNRYLALPLLPRLCLRFSLY